MLFNFYLYHIVRADSHAILVNFLYYNYTTLFMTNKTNINNLEYPTKTFRPPCTGDFPVL